MDPELQGFSFSKVKWDKTATIGDIRTPSRCTLGLGGIMRNLIPKKSLFLREIVCIYMNLFEQKKI